jgi:putative transposase
MYDWRRLSDPDRQWLLDQRKARRFPWHAPPHFEYEGEQRFLITAACYEHKHVIGKNSGRMAECESRLIELCSEMETELFAWCVLPNHYHLLLQTDIIKLVLGALGKFHGSSSYRWNGEDDARGRKVWFKSVERAMRSDRHFYASLNYVNNNAVKHGYVSRWQDWPYSSAVEYLDRIGHEEATRIWNEYPVLDYGLEWDVD